MYNKIMVPLDGSPLAEKALPYACKLARALSAELLLFRIAHETSNSLNKVKGELAGFHVAEDYLAEVKARICAQDQASGPTRVRTLSIYGSSTNALDLAAKISGRTSELVAEEHTDLIVMATHGRSGLSRLVMGSVATSLVKNALTPIVLIHPAEIVQKSTAETNKLPDEQPVIIVPLDGSNTAEEALKPAIELAQKMAASIKLLQVVPSYAASQTGGIDYNLLTNDGTNERKMKAAFYLSTMQEEVSAHGVTCTEMLKLGDPAEELIKEINLTKKGLVVTTTRAPNLVGRIFLGSVADELIRHSQLPVMVINNNKLPEPVVSESTFESFT